ncbi:hypothetical protein [Streptomyces olivaceus]|uniref:hypothetical protein n=1 Tax=Streptomyces olivaceus TaxID=47716 RepID=UPI001CCE9411|nr:hypothetical protein [Streptomyces olivaceus]MBZ6135739.1 hypothetical protein [Streptomyces olivaceus]
MEHTPTPASAPASHTPEVQRALDRIDHVRKDDTSPVFQRLLDYLARMVIASGNPSSVFDRVLEGFAVHDALELAREQGLTLARASKQSAEDGSVTETVVFWAAHLAIVPHGQRASETLVQLRAEVAEHQEEQRLSASFQASVAAGHVEDVDAWFARTNRAGR